MAIDQTLKSVFTKALVANSTATSFTTPAATTTEPTGTGVHELSNNSGNNHLMVIPYGTTAGTVDLRVLGWELFDGLWIPKTMVIVRATLEANLPGVAGASIVNTELFADLIAFQAGDSAAVIPAVGANNLAWFSVDMKGSQKFKFEFDLIATTTNANAIWRTF